MPRRMLVGGAVIAAAGAYLGTVTGRLTLDLGWGRSRRPLGPLAVTIAAPRELVFDVIAAPYLDRTPTAMAGTLRVLERGSDMVLAEHYTPVRRGLVATTVETVRFTRPERVSFRLVRGPVPYVAEEFVLEEGDGVTTLHYHGELAADLWAFGRWWGGVVGERWDAAVAASLAKIGAEAERRAAARDRARAPRR
ncbi:MAG TPA: SRPBCC family protein [Actinomycetes bacterium]|nr:SRPBCC family protein [Actinomycetes bacterium]